VTDPDNAYPDDFSLILEEGNNYTVTNDTVICVSDSFPKVLYLKEKR
jgi:hypothetical protein